MKPKQTIILLAVLVAAIAGGITYGKTRLKWHELGRMSGFLEGQSDSADKLCRLASPGSVHDTYDLALGHKSRLITFDLQPDGLVEIRCAAE